MSEGGGGRECVIRELRGGGVGEVGGKGERKTVRVKCTRIN